MSATIPSLTESLAAILTLFEPHEGLSDEEAIEVGAADVRRLVVSLRFLRKQAQLMEQEIAIHRQDENSRVAAGEMDAQARDALRELIHDPDGRVVFPDFGKKPS